MHYQIVVLIMLLPSILLSMELETQIGPHQQAKVIIRELLSRNTNIGKIQKKPRFKRTMMRTWNSKHHDSFLIFLKRNKCISVQSCKSNVPLVCSGISLEDFTKLSQEPQYVNIKVGIIHDDKSIEWKQYKQHDEHTMNLDGQITSYNKPIRNIKLDVVDGNISVIID